MSFPPFILPSLDCRLTARQLSCAIISPYICTLKTHICTRYLARRVINTYICMYICIDIINVSWILICLMQSGNGPRYINCIFPHRSLVPWSYLRSHGCPMSALRSSHDLEVISMAISNKHVANGVVIHCFRCNNLPGRRAAKLQLKLTIQKYERKMVRTGEKTTCFEDGDHYD